MSDTILQITGEITPGEIDPLLAAIREGIIAAGSEGDAIQEFGEKQVAIIAPEETDAGIDATIKMAMGKTKGLALLLIAGDGKNPDPEAPGPLVTVNLEAQLYVSTRIRGKSAKPPLEMMAAVARLLHLATVKVDGFSLYERIKFIGFVTLPDDDFTAYALQFEREMTL